jgi:hypothetical protein
MYSVYHEITCLIWNTNLITKFTGACYGLSPVSDDDPVLYTTDFWELLIKYFTFTDCLTRKTTLNHWSLQWDWRAHGSYTGTCWSEICSVSLKRK